MPKQILIVDDDQPTQELLQALMRRAGLETTVAGNGAEAIDILQRRSFDVVLLDLMMPAVSGADVIAFMHDRPNRPPVIVCTAAGPRATEAIDASVVKAIIRKPFDILELSAVVTALCDSETNS